MLKRAFDSKRVSAPIWYLPAILLMPCVIGGSCAVTGIGRATALC